MWEGGVVERPDVDMVAFNDDLEADDPASISVRAELMYRPSVVDQLFCDRAEGGIPDETARAWLLDRGVSINAVFFPIAVRAAHVYFDGCGLYVPDAIGVLAFILPATDATGRVVDFAAWCPSTGEIGTRLGNGVFLGDGLTFERTFVHRSPLEWLRAEREGMVILDSERAAVPLAATVIYSANGPHADALSKQLRVPPPHIRVARRRAR